MEEVSGRVREVERLLQVVSLLRAAEGRAVPWSALVEKVYPGLSHEASKKKMQYDRERLAELGFSVANVAPEGAESAFVLGDSAWRLPLDLDPLEQGLLVWVMAAAGAVAAESSGPSTAPEDLSSLLGQVPRGLDLAQNAIAGQRRLVVERDGEDVELEPALLASRHGRWFLLGRYVGEQEVKAPRLDRLTLVRLGPPMAAPVVVPPLDDVLDPTAWNRHDPREARLRCLTSDLGSVRSWFPRGEPKAVDAVTTELAFSYRNEEALVSRTIGLGGVAWIVAPPSVVEALLDQVSGVLEEATT